MAAHTGRQHRLHQRLGTAHFDHVVHAAAPGDAEALFETTNRYRDVLVSPDGRTFYVATDSAGPSKGLDGAMTKALEHPGAILVFEATTGQ